MIVGRAKSPKGPYLDRNGADLARAGGTLVLAGNKDWYGVGHNAVVSFDGADYLVFHGYDAKDRAISKLRIEKIRWTEDGWPEVTPTR
jgi:arabinan endo-1,5-alpha-L-arabinosidase